MIPQYLTDAIIESEGYSPRAKWDQKQFSNGYGTRAQSPDEAIDEGEARSRLNNEVSKSWDFVEKRWPNAPEGVKAAIADLHYNTGETFAKSGLGQALDRGDYGAAKDLLLQYTHAGGEVQPGLVARRQRAASWFDGSPTPEPQSNTGGQTMDPTLLSYLGQMFGMSGGQAPAAQPEAQPSFGAMAQAPQMSRGDAQNQLAMNATAGLNGAPLIQGGSPSRQVDLSRLRDVLSRRTRLGTGVA